MRSAAAPFRVLSAIILASGHLRCGEITGSIHAVATALSGGAGVNGWNVWFYVDEQGRKRPIETLRQALRLELAALG